MKKPETYNELVTVKKCHELAKYFQVSREVVEECYQFLMQNSENAISAKDQTLVFLSMRNAVKTIPVMPKIPIQSLYIDRNKINIITFDSATSVDGGGGSSNNNNNNNNS